ncbi:MAG TPA: glycosyltransferase [Chloroflexota bacterium]|nr:glycosyltransferase [Chloroflexota bacterium]
MKDRSFGRRAIRVLGLPCGAYAAACTGYLLTLTAASLLPRRRPAPPSTLPRFDLVIAAHDEEETLPRLLASIGALDYPPELLRVHVVADNCTDNTAEVARLAGALVHERSDAQRIGKGFALALGMAAALELPGRPDDGLVIVDADSDLAPNVLRVMAAYLAAGAGAIQGYYSVRNAGDSSVAMLRYVALCLYHYLRPLGRARLGLSAGLRGNGMCFRRDVAALGWMAHGLTEDVEQHFRLLEHGIHVTFAPEAVVRAEMPVTLRGAAVQNSRWERGRLEALLVEVPRFLRLAVRRRDPSALDAALEQLVAPLSVCVAACVLAMLAGLLGRSRRLRVLGFGSLIGQAAYVLVGLRLAGAPASAYHALASAPRYISWKAWIWLRATVRPPARWQRTDRLIPATAYASAQKDA